MDEQTLVQAAQKNDLDAFNQLVLAHQQVVYNVALRMLNDLDTADDATQQAFISAYQKIHTFKGGSFQAWILRIVTNKCYDLLRSGQRHPTRSIDDASDDPDVDWESAALMRDDAPLPEEQVAQKELEAAVQHCIDELPREFKAVVILVDLQGMDYQEAAEIVRSPLGTIKSRLARARMNLQDCLHKFKELLPAQYRSESEGSHD
ncbi:MAG TPA: sigma-70 family RNA polymerase sigma factor [Anaerolineaceae bacterium]|jgi:RNA polymerase sigma-70 factor (ECF subfamily)|nr:sigma-70 family RNA polymerase sigma factor [Anaerolineaceae bacterium]